MSLKKALLLAIVLFSMGLSLRCNAEVKQSQVVAAESIKWGYLNPLRGDKSPEAAELWGDRTTNTATGMLVRFKKGFSSPPHIHNVTYRGIVIKGLLHNADPNAKHSWMATGSFWTQPAGENHITAAAGSENLIFLEIDTGPYLVWPSKQAFDNQEHAINQHYSNLVWLNSLDSKRLVNTHAEIAYLYSKTTDKAQRGMMLRTPAGEVAELKVDAKEFRAIVIKGSVLYTSSEEKQGLTLHAGSYFGSTGEFLHRLKIKEDALIYIRTGGQFNWLNRSD